ncbi:MAG TPA: AMP-binding protein [Candidatus Limnocylindrales bacterium]|nr:AMP-binding protein [Candidatus Limnocylindrales bacterium]
MPDTILELVDAAIARYGEREALALRRDDGADLRWSFAELGRRSRLAAWRLRAAGLDRGDRLLTWSPSTPELPAVYVAAMRIGAVLVPLDLRMAPDAIARICARAEPRLLALGTGRDAPDPAEGGVIGVPSASLDDLTADPDSTFPADWEAQVEAWAGPVSTDVYALIFTSGTTAAPKGVILAHDNVLATIETVHRRIPPLEHRVVSLLPLSHLFEQAITLYYALDVGADILYVRSRSPRVIFEAIRDHRTTSMVVVPQLLQLFWDAIEREAERSGRAASFRRLRTVARRLPYALRRVLFRSVHRRLGGGFRLFVSAGAFLPPALQQAWEDLGVIVLQGYGATETGFVTCNSLDDHAAGTVGRAAPTGEVRIATDGEIQFRGPTLFKGYWHDADATAAAFTDDGWYRTGDIGRFDEGGHLHLMGRSKDIVVLPNGLNVYPEDIENELRIAGIKDAIVVETRPGRIEGIILAPAMEDGSVDAAVRAANGRLAVHQRVAAWRRWPDEDFPRTHTFKVRRNDVRAWAVEETPLPVREAEPA